MASFSLVICDFGFTWCPARFFSKPHPRCNRWTDIVEGQIFAAPIADRWLRGEVSTSVIAELLAIHTRLAASDIERYMRTCVRGLPVNTSVRAFVERQRRHGCKTAMVTINSDLFTSEIVLDQRLHDVFDVIVNSADFHTTDKELLWGLVFRALGGGYDYPTSILLDDSPEWVSRFTARGGQGLQYAGESDFQSRCRDLEAQVRTTSH